MAKVICKLPNASSVINGIKFLEHEAGVISEEVSDEVAAAFTSIKGYFLEKGNLSAEEIQKAEAELAELRTRAESLGVTVKGNWKKDRLVAEITKAESKGSTGGDENTKTQA